MGVLVLLLPVFVVVWCGGMGGRVGGWRGGREGGRIRDGAMPASKSPLFSRKPYCFSCCCCFSKLVSLPQTCIERGMVWVVEGEATSVLSSFNGRRDLCVSFSTDTVAIQSRN